jgi:hypothetical protein
MAISKFTESEVIQAGLTVIGELDHKQLWSHENADLADDFRLGADDDDIDDLVDEDEDLEDDDLDDEFEDDEDFEDDFDDEDDDDLDDLDEEEE